MKTNVISLYDKKVKAYTRPVFTITQKKDLAEEYRRMIVTEPQKVFQLKDMELYYLGTFEDEKASFVLLDKPEFIVRLDEFFPKEEPKHE